MGDFDAQHAAAATTAEDMRLGPGRLFLIFRRHEQR